MSLVAQAILNYAIIGSVIIAIYLYFVFNKGRPVAQPASPRFFMPYIIMLVVLGIIGGLKHWAGYMDKVPFIYLGFIYPAIVIHISIRIQNIRIVTIAAALLGSVVMLASSIIRFEHALFVFTLTTGIQGIATGLLSTFILNSEMLKKGESWVIPTLSLVGAQWAGVIASIIVLSIFGIRG